MTMKTTNYFGDMERYKTNSISKILKSESTHTHHPGAKKEARLLTWLPSTRKNKESIKDRGINFHHHCAVSDDQHIIGFISVHAIRYGIIQLYAVAIFISP